MASVLSESSEFDNVVAALPGSVDEFGETSTWHSKHFINPPDVAIQNAIVRRIFGLYNDCHAGLIFMLQLIVASAALPTLQYSEENPLHQLLFMYGMIAFYTATNNVNYSNPTTELLETLKNTGMFDSMNDDELMHHISAGYDAYKHFKETDQDASMYRIFNLANTLNTYNDGNPKLVKRITPFVELCRSVLTSHNITVPEHVPIDTSSSDFVMRMFHAPRMGIPYVNKTVDISRACVAVQMYKNFSKLSDIHNAMSDIFDIERLMLHINNIELIQSYLVSIDIRLKVDDIPIVLFMYNELCVNESMLLGYGNEMVLDEIVDNAVEIASNRQVDISLADKNTTFDAISVCELIEKKNSNMQDNDSRQLLIYALTSFLKDAKVSVHELASVKELIGMFNDELYSTTIKSRAPPMFCRSPKVYSVKPTQRKMKLVDFMR